MKNAILLLLTVLLCVSMLCSCKGKDAAPSTPPAQKSTYEQLLGFESYEEITGARIRVGNMLGNIDINTDPKYITQGNGSIRIAVQGDYAEPTRHPFFMLDFMNTTAATFDFSAYKSISFDVYNDSDEDLHVRANINVGKEDGNFIGTAKKTFTIKAKSWTTCTYDFSMMAGFSLYDFTSVRYMTVEFMEHKQNRDDAPHVFYMDNLIGTFFAEGEQPETISYDFHQGIDFETAGTELLFTGQGKKQDASFERVSFDAVGIEAPENGGAYALRLSSENEYWPTFRIHFGKELQAGTEISFVAYGRIDGESRYNKSIFEFSSGGDATEEFPCDVWTKQTIVLKQAASYVDLFWNYDRAQITSGKANGEVFIDNIVAKDPIPPIEPEGNLWEGLDFEIPGNASLFTGLKLEGAERADAAIERVAYADLDIPALTDGGEYALKLSHESFYWPTFRINFGEKLPKGTIITFQAYARITSGTNNYNKSIFEYREGLGEATDEFPCDSWTELTMELPVDAEYIDLFWNYDRAQITSETASAEVYIDNLIATPGKAPIEPVGDFYEGLNFEIIGNVGYFVGQDIKEHDAVIDWVSYDDVSISAPANGGSHAMRLSHKSFYWPTFRMNFGKTLPAGTKITFQAYGTIQGENLHNQSIFEFSEGGEATVQFPCEKWTKLTITLPKTADHIDLFWNYDRAGIVSSASGAVYIDNMIATMPVKPEGNLLKGVGFEVAGNAALFAPIGGEEAWRDAILDRVKYSDLSIGAPANGGKYALKITCQNSQWPVFRLNFGTTLKAGTVITFDAYTNDTSGIRNTVTSFDYLTGGDAAAEYFHGKWNTRTIILTSNCDHLDLVCNMDRWNEVGPDNLEVYVDNFKAVEPKEAEGDFLEGVDFEIEGNTYLFVGQGNPGSDATIERVSYGDAGVAAPANGGSYALKLSHADHCWPTFRVNFGKTLKAGTTITFDFYGNYDYVAPESGYKYMKLELSATSKDSVTSEDPNQVVWTLVETWKTAAITLTADTDHVEFMYNVADGQHGNVASWLLLDNFKAEEPGEPIEPGEPTEPEKPTFDITQGIDFEEAGEEALFVGQGNPDSDVAFERVTYGDADVAAPANGGSYVLKLSHANYCWPSFRVNFGKTLKAGTVITFNVYGNYDSQATGKYMKLELAGTSKDFVTSEDPNQVVWTLVATWKTATITLTADCDHVDFFYNVADGQHGNVASWLLLDNVKADEPGDPTEPDPSEPAEPTEPEEPTLDITQGIDFEEAGEEALFVGQGNLDSDVAIERVAYGDVNVAAPENGGSYVLKLSHANHCWPSFRVNFGKTLKAGTVITFNVYGNYDSQATGKYMKLELAGTSKDFVTSEDPNQVVWTLVATWKTATITLTADCDHVDFFYNVADGQHGNVASWLLLDNVKADEPGDPTEPEEPTLDFTQGIDFENAGEEVLFVGQGNPGSDVAFERVTYGDASVAAPANGGSYALKLSHANHCWPSFRVNFGKTLKAGTTITFDVYGNYDYAAPAGVNKYMKLELTAGSKNSVTSEDPNQVVWTLVGTWKTATITLTADCDHVDFFYNVADGQHGNVASWLLLDNFKASEPGVKKQLNMAKEPVLQVQPLLYVAQNIRHKFFKVR